MKNIINDIKIIHANNLIKEKIEKISKKINKKIDLSVFSVSIIFIFIFIFIFFVNELIKFDLFSFFKIIYLFIFSLFFGLYSVLLVRLVRLVNLIPYLIFKEKIKKIKKYNISLDLNILFFKNIDNELNEISKNIEKIENKKIVKLEKEPELNLINLLNSNDFINKNVIYFYRDLKNEKILNLFLLRKINILEKEDYLNQRSDIIKLTKNKINNLDYQNNILDQIEIKDKKIHEEKIIKKRFESLEKKNVNSNLLKIKNL